MHIITKRRLADFWGKHPQAKTSLMLWYKLASVAESPNLIELREIFPSADPVANFTVFNIGGNKYRLIALVDYFRQKIFIRHILTHAEYDQDNWKQDDWYN
jgi:mRNA interferase HigB